MVGPNFALVALFSLRHLDEMFGQRSPLAVAMDVCRRVSVDLRVCSALSCPALSVGANDDGRVLIDDDGAVGQRLRFRRIDIAADYSLDKGFFIVWFLGTEAGRKFIIQNASPRRDCARLKPIPVRGPAPVVLRQRLKASC